MVSPLLTRSRSALSRFLASVMVAVFIWLI